MVLHVGGALELFFTLALNTPSYSAAYHDAALDGLARLAELIGHGARERPRRHCDGGHGRRTRVA